MKYETFVQEMESSLDIPRKSIAIFTLKLVLVIAGAAVALGYATARVFNAFASLIVGVLCFAIFFVILNCCTEDSSFYLRVDKILKLYWLYLILEVAALVGLFFVFV